MHIGVIIESNPFHNGHQYLFDYIKNNFNPCCITSITSTSFNMRGEISPITKFNKISYLLKGGSNVVLELPTPLSVQSADLFGYNSVKILNDFNITDIVCGCETGEIDKIKKLLDIITSNEFEDELKIILKSRKISYKSAYLKALESMKIDSELINIFNAPNATLALSYLKAIHSINPKINLHLVKRINVDYHSKVSKNNFASATLLREKINNNENIDLFIPFNQEFINLNLSKSNYFNIIKYKLQLINNNNNNNNNNISTISEGIDNYIINNADWNTSYDNFIENLCNKKYSKSRIKRSLLHLILETPATNLNEKYIRLLGFDEKGLKYINQLPKEIKQDIFSSPKEINNNQILNYELKTTKLFEIISNENVYSKEFQLPIRKETL